MNKISAVIKREYIAVVKTKTFIITTLLIPIGMLLMFSLPFIMAMTKSGVTTVAVLDESNLFTDKIEGNSNLLMKFIEGDLELHKGSLGDSFDAILHIPDFDLQYLGEFRLIAKKQIGVTSIAALESEMNRIIENERFLREGIDKAVIDKLKARVHIESAVISKGVEKKGSAKISLLMGYLMAMMMYFVIFGYGNMICGSVVDEKKNRIVEILVSSIRPFELMIGKILGIGAVAITQLLIWIICGLILIFALVFFAFPALNSPADMPDLTTHMQANQGLAQSLIDFVENPSAVLNLPLLVGSVFFYFIFGYLLYSTLFACTGSLADDNNQTQSYTFLISLMIMSSLFMMIHVIDNPHSKLAIWGSMIPFSSPIIMTARIPFNIPLWQVALSGSILIVSFFCCTWLSGKIYRMGLLLYGKKVTPKDIWKFIKA
ncbi:MAG: ABC transporter permease [Candidatus Cloacimonetes bacterium]|nr:ABC transporter permease [Candidatus Cloacimonadota bacterium]